MPISKKSLWEDQSDLQEKKRAKFESVLIDSEEGKTDITKLTHLTENTRKQNKNVFYQETKSTSMKIQKGEKGDDEVDMRMISSLKISDSRINGDHDKIERQSIKRPVALLPDRCTCTECQIRKNIYFRRYMSSRKQYEIEMRNKSNAKKSHCQEVESDFDVTQGRGSSYFTNPLLVERTKAATREEEIKGTEHCYQRKLPCFEVNNDPQEEYVGSNVEQNYQHWRQRKSKPERVKEENTTPRYSNEQILDRKSSTAKEVKKTERMKETGYEVSSAGMNICNYRIKEEYCGCRECLKANVNASANSEYGLGQWLKRNPGYCESNGLKIRQTKIKEEKQCSPKESSWMTIRKTELENKNSDKKYEPCIEDYETMNGYDKPFVANRGDSLLITKGLIKNGMQGGMQFNVNSCEKKSPKPWTDEELISKRRAIESISKDEKETEEECDMKCEEISTMEAFLFSRKDSENTNGKDKKALAKQHKEKDSGKKSRALANWLERKRVAELNDAFERLRRMVPTYGNEDRSLSKIKTLRYAATYIRHLALIHEKQCRYGIEDLKKDLMKVLEMDPMLQRCHEHLESNCII